MINFVNLATLRFVLLLQEGGRTDFLAPFLGPVQFILPPGENEFGLLVYLLKKADNKSVILESQEVRLLNCSEKARFKGGSSKFMEQRVPMGFHGWACHSLPPLSPHPPPPHCVSPGQSPIHSFI